MWCASLHKAMLAWRVRVWARCCATVGVAQKFLALLASNAMHRGACCPTSDGTGKVLLCEPAFAQVSACVDQGVGVDRDMSRLTSPLLRERHACAALTSAPCRMTDAAVGHTQSLFMLAAQPVRKCIGDGSWIWRWQRQRSSSHRSRRHGGCSGWQQ